jgi:hypothetical protein
MYIELGVRLRGRGMKVVYASFYGDFIGLVLSE